jgi:hypothetical protein
MMNEGKTQITRMEDEKGEASARQQKRKKQTPNTLETHAAWGTS